jgi:hypothetical protein
MCQQATAQHVDVVEIDLHDLTAGRPADDDLHLARSQAQGAGERAFDGRVGPTVYGARPNTHSQRAVCAELNRVGSSAGLGCD